MHRPSDKGGDTVIRLVTSDDAEAVVALLKTVAEEGRWIRTEWPFDVDERIARFREAVEKGSAIRIVAERGGPIVGELGLFPKERDAYLGMFVVASERGRGVGRRLVERAEALARERGLNAIELEVYAHNEAALALYRSCGFIEIGERYLETKRSGETFEVITMKKQL